MKLVIQVPYKKNGSYILMHKMNGCYVATGATFKSKAKAIAYARDQIYNSIVWYDDTIIIWDDSETALNNGTQYTNLKIKPSRKGK